MPWTPKQHALFQAAAASPKVAAKTGIRPGDAKKMAAEGVKKAPPKARKSQGLRGDIESAMEDN